MEIDDIQEFQSQFDESRDIFDQLIRNSPYLGYSGNHNYQVSELLQLQPQCEDQLFQKPHLETKPKTTSNHKNQEIKNSKAHYELIEPFEENKQEGDDEESIMEPVHSTKAIPIEEKLNQTEKKYIFKEKILKNTTRKFTFSKFLAKLFKKYYGEVDCGSEINQKNEEIVRKFKNKRQNNQNMSRDISEIFGIEEGRVVNQEMNKANRLLMWKIMKNHIKDEVIFKQRMKEFKRSYFLSFKTYGIRCRFPLLPQKSCYR